MSAEDSATDSTTEMQELSDAAAVRQTALDYVEGWYEGNAERMGRALHPDLQKRIVEKDPRTGKDRLREMSSSTLIGYTRDGEGTKTPKERQQKDVTIFDIYRMNPVRRWSSWSGSTTFILPDSMGVGSL